jgi:hypothetical protein
VAGDRSGHGVARCAVGPHDPDDRLMKLRQLCDLMHALHYNGVGSRSALGERTHARNPNYSYARPAGDCCGPVVGLSLTEAHRIAVNIAKLPDSTLPFRVPIERPCRCVSLPAPDWGLWAVYQFELFVRLTAMAIGSAVCRLSP